VKKTSSVKKQRSIANRDKKGGASKRDLGELYREGKKKRKKAPDGFPTNNPPPTKKRENVRPDNTFPAREKGSFIHTAPTAPRFNVNEERGEVLENCRHFRKREEKSTPDTNQVRYSTRSPLVNGEKKRRKNNSPLCHGKKKRKSEHGTSQRLPSEPQEEREEGKIASMSPCNQLHGHREDRVSVAQNGLL